MRFFETIDSFITDLLASVSQSMSSGFANSLYSIVAVSYTHLDVYKRQAQAKPVTSPQPQAGTPADNFDDDIPF